MRISRLHHVQITIPRGAEEVARDFYCGVLGLVEIAKPASLQARGGFWLQLDSQQLHVGVEDGDARMATKAHVAYQVDELAAWQAHLVRHGIEIDRSIAIPGYERYEFRDPFGNRVELIQSIMPLTPVEQTS